jgi:hypothetical protein
MTILCFKKLISFLILSIIIINCIFAQSIFSVIHLNDKEDIKQGSVQYITWTRTDFKAEGTSISKGRESLNYNNQVIYDFVEDFNNDSLLSVTTTDFNQFGFVQSRTYYRQNVSGGLILENQIFKYDKNNVLNEILTLDKDAHIIQHTLIKNNEKRLPVELITYNADGTLVEYHERAEYFFEDNMYISKIYSSDEELLSSNYEILDFNVNYKFNNSDVYNKFGDLIKSYISDEGYILHKYKYDELYNWIEYHVYELTFSKKGKKNKKLITIYKRHFEY